ncbi:MAG: hypothetical protein GY786_06500 [Proteobacteria bacterium]|nr:hypothetical protein [Pseudomonadota bacterium]
MKQLSLLFILLIFCNNLSAQNSDKERIEWAIFDKAPFYILSGLQQGKGVNDGLLKLLQNKLGAYDHRTLRMNPSNYLHEVQYKSNLCMVSLNKNRVLDKILHFSKPATIYLPPRLIMKVDIVQYSDVAEEISITELFHNPELKGALELGRNYLIGNLIPKNLEDSNFVFLDKGADYIFNKLYYEEINYMIESPMMINYMERINEMQGEMVSIPIWEVPTHQVGYVNCTKNDWGKRVIRQVNQVLTLEQKGKQFRKITERWLSANERKRFRRLYNQYILKSEVD